MSPKPNLEEFLECRQDKATMEVVAERTLSNADKKVMNHIAPLPKSVRVK